MDDWKDIPPFDPPGDGQRTGYMGNQYAPPPGGQHDQDTLSDEIEKIKAMVGRHFPIYNVEYHFNTISLACNIDPDILEDEFDALRKEMKADNYIPILKYEKGEYFIHVVKQPAMKFRSINMNLILFITTIITTIFAGSLLWILIMNNAAETFDLMAMFEIGNIGNGALFFAFPLMLILGVHEMAHYYAARHHGIEASLPFFIPVPPIFIPPLGTMGAFISIREPIPNKKALLDIGIAGPIAGFAIAIPVTVIGLMLSSPLEVSGSGVIEGNTILIGNSLLFMSIKEFLPIPDSILLHPTAFAGWVGLFITALNLLPAGQLDGGHVARALLGDRAQWASYAAFGIMLILGLQFTGWLIFAMIIMFLGLRHPPPLNDVTKLDDKRKALGVAAALILAVCFVPIPFDIEQPVYKVDMGVMLVDGNLSDSPSFDVDSFTSQWNNITIDILVNSSANIGAGVRLSSSSSNESLCLAGFDQANSTNLSSSAYFELEPAEDMLVALRVYIPPGANGSATVSVAADYYDNSELLDPSDFEGKEWFEVQQEIRIYLNIEPA